MKHEKKLYVHKGKIHYSEKPEILPIVCKTYSATHFLNVTDNIKDVTCIQCKMTEKYKKALMSNLYKNLID